MRRAIRAGVWARIRSLTAAGIASAALAAATASATTTDPESAASDEVVVKAAKRPFSIDAKALRRAAVTYEKDRSLAPEAPLRFRVIDYTPKAEVLRIWIERGDVVETVAVGADGLLTLPPTAFAKGARVHANRSGKDLKMLPEILSPGTTLRVRRFGDLRLQCRVTLSFTLDELPLYIRAMVPPVGIVCNSGSFGFSPYVDIPVESAEIRGANTSKRVHVGKGSFAGTYVAPLGERSIGDEAIIELK